MPDLKISQLAVATSIADPDLLVIVQGGITKQITRANSAFETTLTFSQANGLERVVNDIRNTLITGIAGNQTVVGGTFPANGLTYKGTSANGTLTAAAHTFVGGNNGATTILSMLNSGDVGIGVAPNSAYALIVERSDTDPSSVYGLLADRTITLTAPNANEFVGSYGGIFLAGTANATGRVAGLFGEVSNDGSGTATDIRGVWGNALAASTSTVTSAAGGYFQFYTAGTATITSAYGVRVEMLQNPGTITNTYGVYVGDITTGTQTNTPYSFYASDANAFNYFAGKIIYPYGTPGVGKVLMDDGGGTGIAVWTTPAAGGVSSVSGTTDRITSTGGATPVIDIAATYVGQTSITTLGTITTGTLGSGSKILVGSDATGDIYYNGGSGAITRLAAGAAGTYLRFAGAGAAPIVSTLVLPNSATAGYIPYATATNTLGETSQMYFGSVAGLTVGGNTTGTGITNGVGLAVVNISATTNNWASVGFADTMTGVYSAMMGVQMVDRTNHYGDYGFATRAADGFLERMRIVSTGNVGIGTVGLTVSAKLHLVKTTEQLRVGYDTSNYYSTTVGSTGIVTFNAVGAGSSFLFSDNVQPVARLLLPMGEISYFSTTGTAIVIAAISDGSTNMVKAAPATTLVNDLEFDNDGANDGTLRYIGTTTKTFHVACTISISPDAANDTFVFGIAKNGTVEAASKVIQKLGATTDSQSTALHLMVSLATNDTLELYTGNMTSTSDAVIKTLNLFAMGM